MIYHYTAQVQFYANNLQLCQPLHMVAIKITSFGFKIEIVQAVSAFARIAHHMVQS